MMKYNEIMFNGTAHICYFCKKKMKRHIPKTGRFKGQIQSHSFVCDCAQYTKNTVIMVG